MSKANEEIEYNFLKTVADPTLKIAPELLELGLDELASNDVVTKLPVIGSFLAVGKTVVAIRDVIFVKNILIFLKGVAMVEPEVRQKWLDKLEKEGFQQKVGEEIFSIIDKLKDKRKNEIGGLLFARHIKGEFEFKKFSALCEKLDRLFMSDIRGLETGLPIHEDDKERFRSFGLYIVNYPGIKQPELLQFASNKKLIPNQDLTILIEVIRESRQNRNS